MGGVRVCPPELEVAVASYCLGGSHCRDNERLDIGRVGEDKVD